MSALTPTTCKDCTEKHGTIFPFNVNEAQYIPAHINGQCRIVPMRTKQVGTATNDGVFGADMYLMYTQSLPNNYISKTNAIALGWSPKKGTLHSVAPSKTIFGGIYRNKNGKLPSKPGRMWYEADINYVSGYRNHDRILFSSDGLIFVTYDHYKTYYEIIR